LKSKLIKGKFHSVPSFCLKHDIEKGSVEYNFCREAGRRVVEELDQLDPAVLTWDEALGMLRLETKQDDHTPRLNVMREAYGDRLNAQRQVVIVTHQNKRGMSGPEQSHRGLNLADQTGRFLQEHGFARAVISMKE
jgi:inhibitor of KinA sporulation pathway (predicted exonuclease)